MKKVEAIIRPFKLDEVTAGRKDTKKLTAEANIKLNLCLK
jgi:nitrogen regulatory protein PII